MRCRLSHSIVLFLVLCTLAITAAAGPHTKSVSGKLRSINDNVMVIQKRGMVADSTVEIAMDDQTKKSGQVAPGMHVKVKYREEKGGRKVAVEIEAEPEFASKTAKEAARHTRKP